MHAIHLLSLKSNGSMRILNAHRCKMPYKYMAFSNKKDTMM